MVFVALPIFAKTFNLENKLEIIFYEDFHYVQGSIASQVRGLHIKKHILFGYMGRISVEHVNMLVIEDYPLGSPFHKPELHRKKLFE